MRRHFATIEPFESLREALQVMRLGRLRHLLVANGDQLIGVLSYRDVQELLDQREECGGAERRKALAELDVARAMRAPPVVLHPDTPLAEAAERLDHLHLGCLPVVEDGPDGALLVGMVTEVDLLRAAYGG